MSGRLFASLLLASSTAFAIEGDVYIHDPSTVIAAPGGYYTYGTGNGMPMLQSDDGFRWRQGSNVMEAVPGGKPGDAVLAKGGNNTWAPDLVHLGDKYFLYYSAPGTQPKSAIGLLVGGSLDPKSADYRWQDAGPVVWSDGEEDSNAIDPGVFVDRKDASLWLTYGSYFGYIRLVQLDPRTGLRLQPNAKAYDIAINGEASIIIQHDDWYYLLLTHGSCCAGANSSYNIRMGRSHNIKGPYLDNMGIDMLQGGGKLFLGSGGRRVGPGHFGLLDLGDGVQRFSLHYEADLNRAGRSVLDIRPLLWRDGWPVAGDHVVPGTYQLESVRTGTALEMAVEGQAVGGPRRPDRNATGSIDNQTPAQVAERWPQGTLPARMAQYMLQAQQKWNVVPVADAGGYPGEPWFRIGIAGSELTLTATAEDEVVIQPQFNGSDAQLWRLDQLADGSYRLMPKLSAARNMALSAIGSSTPTLQRFDPNSDRQRWWLKEP